MSFIARKVNIVFNFYRKQSVLPNQSRFLFLSVHHAYKALLSQFGIRNVVPFSVEEQSVLNEQFERNPYPTKEDRERIAMNMGHPFKKIDNWFLQKRFKVNKAKNVKK